jgi:hypothetical protein
LTLKFNQCLYISSKFKCQLSFNGHLNLINLYNIVLNVITLCLGISYALFNFFCKSQALVNEQEYSEMKKMKKQRFYGIRNHSPDKQLHSIYSIVENVSIEILYIKIL